MFINAEDTSLYRRELLHPMCSSAVFSFYKSCWQGCAWERFLAPRISSTQGPPTPSTSSTPMFECVADPAPSQPGVYEFSLVERLSGCRVVVYAGESNNVSRRHQEYSKTGSQLLELLNDYIGARRFELHRRVRTLPSKAAAERFEAMLLLSYDYAWNAKLNGKKRKDLEVLPVEFCCCFCPCVRIVDPVEGDDSLVLGEGCAKGTWHVRWATSLLICVLSAANIALIAIGLDDNVYMSGPEQQAQNSPQLRRACFITSDVLDATYCDYGYAANSVIVAISCGSFLSLILAWRFVETRRWTRVILAAVLVVWSAVWSALYHVNSSSEATLPRQGYREAVDILNWVVLGFLVVVLTCF